MSIGREEWRATDRLPRHRHAHPYVAIVLSGAYWEAGDRGRFLVQPGNAVVHGPFEAHLNHFQARTEILNLPAPLDFGLPARWRLRDPDQIVRAASSDPLGAAALLFEQIEQVDDDEGSPRDWPDALARDLLSLPKIDLAQWAFDHHLTGAALSRGFRQAFGTSPIRYRLEGRTRRAMREIVGTIRPLAQVALGNGFTDQAHMTRAVRAIAGATPRAWRHHCKCVQDWSVARA